jgi:hypothetical protein
MSPHRTRNRAPAAGIALACLAVLAPAASGKGLDLALDAGDRTPTAGQRVEITLRGTADPEITQPCRHVRVVVVAPGTSVRTALRSLEGGVTPRSLGRWDAFRLGSLRSVGRLRWEGALRPNRPGRWTLVVPNRCARGYVLPEGVTRLHLDVRPTSGEARAI